MAFQNSYETDQGIVLPSAYFRITTIRADWHAGTAHIVVAIFKDAAARAENKEPVGYNKYTISPYPTPNVNASFDDLFSTTLLSQPDYNPLLSVYVWLMGLPENSGAVPV